MRSTEITKRLNRIEGQVAGIRRMQEEGRRCVEVLDQIAAVRAALAAVGLEVLERHVDGCVREALAAGDGDEKTDELVAAVRRYVRTV